MLTFELVASSSHSEISIFSNLLINFPEVLCIRPTYISKKDLEAVVKTRGDAIVTGYIRFKKVKTVKGYKEACERASLHLSIITKAFEQKDGSYVVVVRFRLLFILIMLLLTGLFFALLQYNFKADEKEPVEYINPETPTIKEVQKEYRGMFISVPGYVQKEVDINQLVLEVYNPPSNDCVLIYQMYYEEELVGTSNYIYPGNVGSIVIGKKFDAGMYDMKLLARGISLDQKTEYNSVSQKVEISIG